jgi:hypothetical protein
MQLQLDAALIVPPYRLRADHTAGRAVFRAGGDEPMSRFSSACGVLLAVGGLLTSAGAAHATCAIPDASYQGGAYGAYAVTAGGCFMAVDQNGGTGFTTAAASSSFDSLSLSATADLATGVLTAYSQGGFASSSIWDSFTYTGLPSGEATITATLGLPGTLTGSSYGFAVLEEGQIDLSDVYSVFFNTTATDPKPPSIPLSFNVVNGDPVIVFAEIEGVGDSLGGIANLGDPPTLSLDLPKGAAVSTASGVFDNFVSATVPEPSTWAMMLIGFAGLGVAGYRTSRKAVSIAALS